MFGERLRLLRGSRNAQVIAAAVTRVATGRAESAIVEPALVVESPVTTPDPLEWMSTIDVAPSTAASYMLGIADPLASLNLPEIPPVSVHTVPAKRNEIVQEPYTDGEQQLPPDVDSPIIESLSGAKEASVMPRKFLRTPGDFQSLQRILDTTGAVPDWLRDPQEVSLAAEYLSIRSRHVGSEGWAGL